MRVVSVLLSALALGIAAAPAGAASGDLAATHAYIQANYRLAQTSVGLINTAQAKIERLNTNLAHQCPHEGLGSLQNEASQPVTGLVVVALWSLAYGTAAAPIRTFAETVKGLHWSNSAITRAANGYAKSLREMSALPVPDLCQVVRSWKASGFQVVPPGVVAMVQHAESIELTPLPARMLAPFVRGSDAGTRARTSKLEEKLAKAEFVHGVHDLFQVLATLGLQE